MRPITKGAAPANYPPANMDFSLAVANAISALINTPVPASVPVDDCLELWLDQVKEILPPQPPRTGGVADLNKAVTAIKVKVSDIYKSCSLPLLGMIGPFCSYCETPISGLLEVEHRAPKANYPTFSVAWKNFLLCCSACNIRKTNHPQRSVVEAWMNPPDPDPSEDDYYEQIANRHFVWPDLDPQSYTKLPVVLFAQANDGSWHQVPIADAVNFNNQITSVDFVGRTVRAAVSNIGPNVPVRLYVYSEDPRGAEMIGLYQPNTVGDETSSHDRRLMNRTIAWFTCLAMFRTISQMPPASWNLAFELFKMLAASTGFYSVWLTILRQVDVPGYRRFVIETNKVGYFPGTNTAGLPNS